MSKKFIKFIDENKKRDCYAIDIVINKKEKDVAVMGKQINIEHGIYPDSRKIKKLFENEIKEIIIQNKFFNAKVYVKFICMIGTFKKKNLRIKR